MAWKTWRFALVVAMSFASGSGAAIAGLIIPTGVTGSGAFFNNASLIIDGVLPPRGTLAADPREVSWNSTSTFFTIDFGSIQTVGSLIVGVDNNDDYVIQSSTDGTNFKSLFTFLASDGPVTPAQGGSDILTTDSTYPSAINYPGDATTPEYVGRGFSPTNARYLRISAANGDSVYAIGEVEAFTPNALVPEPSSLWLASSAGLIGIGYWSRRRRSVSAR